MIKKALKEIPHRPIMASATGGALEHYDFMIFGYLTPIISPKFFPGHDPFVSTLLGFSVFTFGFLIRPIGSIIFGHIGDRWGRRKALTLTLFFMGFGTLLMGLLPTYDTIGIFAPILLLSGRLLQGLSLGGESTGGLIFSVEHTIKHRGFAASLFHSGSFCGSFLGSLVCMICTLPFMPESGWRIPFIIGFSISLIGLYIRLRLMETPEFCSIKTRELEKWPLFKFIKMHLLQSIVVIVVMGFSAVIIIMNCVFLPSLLRTLPTITGTFSKLCGTASLCSIALSLPVFGFLSDKMNRFNMMMVATIGSLLLVSFMFFYLEVLNPSSILLNIILIGIFIAMFFGGWGSLGVELFNKKFRYSGLSVSTTIGYSLFGGTIPLLATYLTGRFSNGLGLLNGYIVTLGILALFGIRLLKQAASRANVIGSYSHDFSGIQ